VKTRNFLMTALLTLGVVACAPATQAQKVLKVGSTPTGVPFTFLDTKTNTIDGVMVDVIKAVGKEAGFEVQIEPMAFSALIGSLTSRRIDLISAAMFATDKRKEIIDFSDIVYSYGDGLMQRVENPRDYKTFDDMKGMTLGVQIGTAFVEPAQKSGVFKEVKLYDSPPDMMRDLDANRIQGGLMDYPIAAFTIGLGNYPNIKMSKTYQPSVVGHIGIGVRKQDAALKNDINAALAKLKADGTIAQILKKWKLSDD